MQKKSHVFFTNIVFFQLNEAQKNDIQNFITIYTRFYKINYIFEEDILELKKYQNENTLFVSDHNELSNKLISFGLIFQLSVDAFLLSSNELYQFKNFREDTIAVLAFLPEDQNLILTKLFKFFGLKVKIVLSKEDFFNTIHVENKDHSIVILDTDFYRLDVTDVQKTSIKASILKQLLKVKNHNLNLSTILIKDFSKGNFYEDILLSVKKISNVILNFNELNLFLMQFLYLYQHKKYHHELKISQNETKILNELYSNENDKMTHHLKNIKQVFDLVTSVSLEKIFNIQNNNRSYENELILKFRLLKQYFNRFLLEDKEQKRESFIFFNREKNNKDLLKPQKIQIEKKVSSNKEDIILKKMQKISLSKTEGEKEKLIQTIPNRNQIIQKEMQSAIDKIIVGQQ